LKGNIRVRDIATQRSITLLSPKCSVEARPVLN
jgi:hypothetical protein